MPRIDCVSTILVCLLAWIVLGTAALGAIPEAPMARVNDFTGTLSPDTRSELEEKLAQFERKTSTQVVVAIVPTLEGLPVEDYSIRLAEKWKVGQAGKGNGVILLVAKAERKVRIEVGYGLEGVLPDSVAGRIIREKIAPSFKEGNYDKGISDGVGAIISAASGAGYSPDAGASRPRRKKTPDLVLLFIPAFILAIIGRSLIQSVLGKAGLRTGRTRSSALFAGGLATGVLAGSVMALLLGLDLLVGGFVGLVCGFLAPLSAHGGGFYMGGGGMSFGGGGFYSSGDSGGGFSGGGGDFGGGGASGDW
ncbi:MAG: TPM domain-containing protein [Armatimonadetes bacterium]|nr:TPM domain-containing protein [Armatimonadota bacterium]